MPRMIIEVDNPYVTRQEDIAAALELTAASIRVYGVIAADGDSLCTFNGRQIGSVRIEEEPWGRH